MISVFFYALNEENGALLAHMFSIDRDETKEPTELTHLLKEPIKTNFYEGTFGTLEKALLAFYDDIKLKEWHEYGGKPYHFKLELNNAKGVTPDDLQKIEQIIIRHKNARSVYEGATIKALSHANIYTGIAHISGESIRVFPRTKTQSYLNTEGTNE
ncbi:MAG: phage tail protein [Wolinella sp.]